MNCKQGDDQTLTNYEQVFSACLLTFEGYGGWLVHLGVLRDVLPDVAQDPDNPTEDELNAATDIAKHHCNSRLFLLNLDSSRYGDMLADLHNTHTKRVGRR